MTVAELARTDCTSCEGRASCILGDVTEAVHSEISAFMTSLRFEGGEIVWREGVYRPGCFIICQGRARLLAVRMNEDERRRIICFFQAGDLIPCIDDLYLGDPVCDCALRVEAVTPVWIHYLPAEPFRSLLLRSPAIAVKVIESLSTAAAKLLREIEAGFCLDARGRLARALLLLREVEPLGPQPHSQQFLADMLGMCRRVAHNELHRLVQEGLIVMEHRRIRILDEERLKREIQ